jgi:hypothetical protein
MIRKNKNKHAQVTIFIVIALIIVVAIALIFVIWRRPTVTISPTASPEAYIERCMKDYTKEAIDLLSEQGGDIEPEGSVMYKDKEITYLCYNTNFYTPCINQRPMLIEHIESEISNYLEPKMRSCFSSLKSELEKRNYVVDMGSMNIITDLQTRKVITTAERKLQITKNQETRKFEKFKESVANPIYDLAEIAMEIANQEAHYCNFDILGFMIIYPEYDITKFTTGDSDIIYTLKEIASGKEFTFAIRSCAMPAGF